MIVQGPIADRQAVVEAARFRPLRVGLGQALNLLPELLPLRQLFALPAMERQELGILGFILDSFYLHLLLLFVVLAALIKKPLIHLHEQLERIVD